MTNTPVFFLLDEIVEDTVFGVEIVVDIQLADVVEKDKKSKYSTPHFSSCFQRFPQPYPYWPGRNRELRGG